MTVEGKILTIRVDLTQEVASSPTGGTITIASTEGAASVPGHAYVKVRVNVFRDMKKEEKERVTRWSRWKKAGVAVLAVVGLVATVLGAEDDDEDPDDTD